MLEKFKCHSGQDSLICTAPFSCPISSRPPRLGEEKKAAWPQDFLWKLGQRLC